MKGFRQKPQGGRKERLQSLEVEIKNMSMAIRISQSMLQQTMSNMKHMSEDIGRSLGLINELQYKILAIQEASGLDVGTLNNIANMKHLKDFEEASEKEDINSKFSIGDVVLEDSTVILTSTAEGDKGIFRSRIKLSECGVPDLITAFMGREIGAKAIVKLNDLDHEVELLAIRNPAKEEEVVSAAPVAEQPTS